MAQGIESGLAAYFTDRPMAVRYDALVPGGTAATLPAPVEGLGPPFWIPTISRASLGAIPIRLTNTGTKAWPNGLSLLAGWGQTDQPYLRQPPDGLAPIGIDVPQLGPGESVELRLPTSPPSSSARSVLWVTLAGGDQAWTTFGSPPLQLAIEAP